MEVQDVHARSLATSTALSEYYFPGLVPPLEVIRALERGRVPFVLVGTHGLGGWTKRPRTTADVDVLVTARGHRRAVSTLLAAFPCLEPEDQETKTRLRDRETKAARIDVMRPNQQLYAAALESTHTVRYEGQTYRVPSLEMTLAMKFAAMRGPSRDWPDRYMDAGDFIGIVNENPDIDLKALHALGQLVYNGGGDELVEKVRQVRAGEKLNL